MRLVLLGPPGAEKARRRREWPNVLPFRNSRPGTSTPRDAVASGSALGARVKDVMERGDLVPDDVVIAVVADRRTIRTPPTALSSTGFPGRWHKRRPLIGNWQPGHWSCSP